MDQQSKISATVHGVMTARADWLEDVLAGLLSNGVRKDEIEVQEHPPQPGQQSARTVVAVRGEPKYEFTMIIDSMKTRD